MPSTPPPELSPLTDQSTTRANNHTRSRSKPHPLIARLRPKTSPSLSPTLMTTHSRSPTAIQPPTPLLKMPQLVMALVSPPSAPMPITAPLLPTTSPPTQATSLPSTPQLASSHSLLAKHSITNPPSPTPSKFALHPPTPTATPQPPPKKSPLPSPTLTTTHSQ